MRIARNCCSPVTSWPPRRHLGDVTHTHTTHTHQCTLCPLICSWLVLMLSATNSKLLPQSTKERQLSGLRTTHWHSHSYFLRLPLVVSLMDRVGNPQTHKHTHTYTHTSSLHLSIKDVGQDLEMMSLHSDRFGHFARSSTTSCQLVTPTSFLLMTYLTE